MGRSMTGGGEGPSVAEVAASLPARLLGAIEELKSSKKILTKEKEKKEKEKKATCFSGNSKRSDSLSFRPIAFL